MKYLMGQLTNNSSRHSWITNTNEKLLKKCFITLATISAIPTNK
jgi:hypothetical protein